MTKEIQDPILSTVDIVVLTIEDGILKVLLHKRPNHPYAGVWALPGGWIHPDEDSNVKDAAERILETKTGVQNVYMEQLATYSGPTRDPRGWSISAAHLVLAERSKLHLKDNKTLALFGVFDASPLAFDHEKILIDAVYRLRSKASYSTLPAELLPPTFTLSQLHSVYEMLLGHNLNVGSFRRKILSMGAIEDTGLSQKESSGRPASLFRLSKGAETFDRSLTWGW